jgi:HK97 gp10 family phage protein
MADTIRLHVTGLAELSAALRQLPITIAQKVLRGTVNAGAKPILDAVRSNAVGAEANSPHVQSGTLLRAIYMKQIPELSSEIQQVFYVGVRRGRGQQAKGQDAYYWSWVEFGHHIVPRTSKNGGSTITARREAATAFGPPKYVVPHPFMRPGFEQAKDGALAAMLEYMGTRITKEANKISKP